MDIVFIRHGQPKWAVDGLSQTDPSLTDLGQEQAALAANRVEKANPQATELVVSPALRSQQTAKPIAAQTGADNFDR